MKLITMKNKFIVADEELLNLSDVVLFDINNFIKEEILNNMKVNSELYDNYKYGFLNI